MSTTLSFQYVPTVSITGVASAWDASVVSKEDAATPTVVATSGYAGSTTVSITKTALNKLYIAGQVAGFETDMHTHFKGAIKTKLLADLNLADGDVGNEFSGLTGFDADYDTKWAAFKAALVANEGAKPVLTTVDKLHIVFTFTSTVPGFSNKIAVYEVPVVGA
jgi:hypothetical protein